MQLTQTYIVLNESLQTLRRKFAELKRRIYYQIIQKNLLKVSSVCKCFRVNPHPAVAWMSRVSFLKTGPAWLNGCVLIYELSDCGFESRCSVIHSFENDKVEILEDDCTILILQNNMIILFFNMAKLDIILKVPSCTKNKISSKQFRRKFHNITGSKFYLLIK